MAGQRRLWNSVLMPTQSRTIVGGAKTRREPGSTCLCKKSLASGFPGQASIVVTEAVGTFTQASIIVTQAAGRGGQPGQLPHPAALLKRGWGVRERERGIGELNARSQCIRRGSHIRTGLPAAYYMEKVSQLLKRLLPSKPVKLDLGFVLKETWSLAEVSQSLEKLLLCIVEALFWVKLGVDQSPWHKWITAKGGSFQHGNPISLVLRRTDDHVALREGGVELLLVCFKAPSNNSSSELLSRFLEYIRKLTVCLTDYAHFELESFLQQLEDDPEEGLRVLVMLPPMRPGYMHHRIGQIFSWPSSAHR